MVLKGYAWAFTKYAMTYIAEQQWAGSDKVGVHQHGCQPAWEYRAERRP
jgi:endonuclease YncB( thermonuclease family)